MLIFGVGVFDEKAGPDNKVPRAYWSGILRRCYSEESLVRWPSYRGTTVCEEWHSFSAFKQWFLTNYKEGWDLDKDVLANDSKVYSPATCVFIPQWLNKFMTSFKQKEGRELPTGVYRRNTYYRARGRHPFKGEIQIGYFPTIEEAREAYLRHKRTVLQELRPQLDAIDTRIYPNMLSKLK